METIFQSTTGMQMEQFLKSYGEKIKHKHVLYVVTTNLEEDRQLQRGRTRQILPGINVKIGKSSGNPYARLKSYTNMSSNFSAQFPQSGVRVLFVRSYQKRKESESGKLLVDVAETLLKRALRNLNKLVPKRGSEIFNIDLMQLFDLIETLDLGDLEYDERRTSERLGKRLLWLVTDTFTGRQKLEYAKDYDEVMAKYALENDRQLMDPRSKHITKYYIRPILRQVPPRNAETSFSVGADDTSIPGQTTVQMPGTPEVDVEMQDASDFAGESPYRVMPRRRIDFDEDEVQTPLKKKRPATIPTSGLKRQGQTDVNTPSRRRRPSPPEPQPVNDAGEPVLGITSKRFRSLKDILKDPRANKIRSETIPTSGLKRSTYKECTEKQRSSEGRCKSKLTSTDTTTPGFSIRDFVE